MRSLRGMGKDCLSRTPLAIETMQIVRTDTGLDKGVGGQMLNHELLVFRNADCVHGPGIQIDQRRITSITFNRARS